MKRILAIAGIALLSSCATTAQNTFVAAEASDSGALAAISVYESTGKASATAISKLLADQATVDTYLNPDEAAIKAGLPLTNTTALTNAVSVLVSDAVAAGIINGSN
jgi:hypothetical protein